MIKMIIKTMMMMMMMITVGGLLLLLATTASAVSLTNSTTKVVEGGGPAATTTGVTGSSSEWIDTLCEKQFHIITAAFEATKMKKKIDECGGSGGNSMMFDFIKSTQVICSHHSWDSHNILSHIQTIQSSMNEIVTTTINTNTSNSNTKNKKSWSSFLYFIIEDVFHPSIIVGSIGLSMYVGVTQIDWIGIKRNNRNFWSTLHRNNRNKFYNLVDGVFIITYCMSHIAISAIIITKEQQQEKADPPGLVRMIVNTILFMDLAYVIYDLIREHFFPSINVVRSIRLSIYVGVTQVGLYIHVNTILFMDLLYEFYGLMWSIGSSIYVGFTRKVDWWCKALLRGVKNVDWKNLRRNDPNLFYHILGGSFIIMYSIAFATDLGGEDPGLVYKILITILFMDLVYVINRIYRAN